MSTVQQSKLAFYNPVMHLTSTITTSTEPAKQLLLTRPYAKKNAPVEVKAVYDHVAVCHFLFASTTCDDIIAIEDLETEEGLQKRETAMW
jgi:hypothetical protein